MYTLFFLIIIHVFDAYVDHSQTSGKQRNPPNFSQCFVSNKQETHPNIGYFWRTASVRNTSSDNDKQLSANNRLHINAENETPYYKPDNTQFSIRWLYNKGYV